jgi:hypothetical protein
MDLMREATGTGASRDYSIEFLAGSIELFGLVAFQTAALAAWRESVMATEKQAEANRQNALQSTGPRTQAGIEAARFNALRHGLRSLQTLIPGEDPEAWEAHRAGVVEDLKPAGTVELALAEQVAAKLWRLGRVVRHEADLITIGQARDELLQGHDNAVPSSYSSFSESIGRAKVPNSKDVSEARSTLRAKEEKVQKWEAALQALEVLQGFKDSDVFEKHEWPLFDALNEDLELEEWETDKLFKDEREDFAVHHARTMLKKRGAVEDVTAGMLAYWRDEKIPELKEKARKAEKVYKNILRRYEAALDRLRVSRGLPDAAALDKIQRYEAHLETGLHKALDRLRTLQEARGAVPSSQKPAVAVAVIQTSPEAAGMGSFGSLAIERGGPGGPTLN